MGSAKYCPICGAYVSADDAVDLIIYYPGEFDGRVDKVYRLHEYCFEEKVLPKIKKRKKK